MHSLLLVSALLVAADAPDRTAGATMITAKIDELTAKHWKQTGVTVADPCADATFLRRVTLDLAGRIPTVQEAKAFAGETSPDKRAKVIRRLVESPEYGLHLGRVLDDIVMDKYAGDNDSLEYLRKAVAQRKPWDQVFREVMLGPWDGERKGAGQFLMKRIKSVDDVTTDTSVVFFGVNVSCAKCHDHPLVSDWTQDHYYGMVSFFNRTSAQGGNKGNPGGLTEKNTGDVSFNTTKGVKKTAKVMFLSGKVVEEPKSPPKDYSRRAELVNVALEEKKFFSRAIVNHLWSNLLGRGIVQPVDQLHSANLPSIPGLLEWLADDLVANKYDLDRLVAGIVSSRVYQLASTPKTAGKAASEKDFAQAQLRPLTPYQLAFSMMLATGETPADQSAAADREKFYRQLEGQASRFARSKLIDPRSDRYQSSTNEALYMSNHADVQKLAEPSGKNLTARLGALASPNEIVDTAVWTMLSRAPEAEERAFLMQWMQSKPEKARACGQLVWALMTSAEFRFNH